MIMRNLSLKSLLVIALAVFVSSCVSTQLPDSYSVEPEVLEAHGGNVSVKVTGTIPAKSFHKKAIVEFQPFLKYDGKTKDLKPLTLKGEKAPGEGTVVSLENGATISYSDNFEYTPEMESAELWVRIVVKKGSKEQKLDDKKLADGIIITPLRVGRGEDVQIAPHNYKKEVIISKTANIYYAYNKANYSKSLKLNKDNVAEVDAFKAFIAQGWKIKDININAWASPEGELSLNQELSQKRGTTAEKQIQKEIKKLIKAKESLLTIEDAVEDIKYNTVAKGEDYDGFMAALNKSDIADKNKISNVIKSQGTKAEREKQIRNMTVIYKEVDEMLSVLRRAEVTVNCYEPKLSDADIAKLSTTKPDSLKENELLFAATLTQDLETQLKIYKSATSLFPKSWRGYNNAAAIYLKMGKMEEAAQLLEKANALNEGNGLIANNLGVIAAWNKDYEAAEKYYQAASAAGVTVSYNMAVIHMIKGNYGTAVTGFGSKSCDYNLALAQLANGDAAAATKTLDCMKTKDAAAHYLLAVIGARTNNVSMMADNLKKAIDMVPEYKNIAKKDAEFVKFFTKAEFTKLVN
jgi:Flp pilus assembly protein TadD